ncbi:Uu.00g029620.m01.CDS01 [Anthostomella pinea]|uniref:Uu.00g029620.m01.CDS01 n=1 Tax=Anthostomella pinea TaxID=933095 RepID=A0AAI8V806_9PEZI|nr:Uu.00g029620.m01.CDS01 [Anthostomella pinea]
MALPYPRTSLLGLPAEIRLAIYKYVLAPCSFKDGYWQYLRRRNCEQPSDSPAVIEVLLVGSFSNEGYEGHYRWKGGGVGEQSNAGPGPRAAAEQGDHRYRSSSRPRHRRPWALARVYRTMHTETAPLLASIDLREVHFSFHAFTADDLRTWTRRMGPERTALLCRFSFEGYGWDCNEAVRRYREDVYVYSAGGHLILKNPFALTDVGWGVDDFYADLHTTAEFLLEILQLVIGGHNGALGIT